MIGVGLLGVVVEVRCYMQDARSRNADGHVDGVRVVSAAQVLHERAPGREHSQRGDARESVHRPQPGLEPAMIGLDLVVRVSLEDVPGGPCELLDGSRVDPRPVGLSPAENEPPGV